MSRTQIRMSALGTTLGVFAVILLVGNARSPQTEAQEKPKYSAPNEVPKTVTGFEHPSWVAKRLEKERLAALAKAATAKPKLITFDD